MDCWHLVKEWFLGLGEHYHVNPFIFGGIYVGAVPFFFVSLYRTINNIRQHKPFIIPGLLTGFFFISAYLYLIIAGQHIPVWVYVFIGAMFVYGVYSTIIRIKTAVKK